MAIKTVFETSFALKRLLQSHNYIVAEPRFSMQAFGRSVNVFSSENQRPNNELILEVLPPYYSSFEFNNFDPLELDEANKFFFENLKIFLIGMNRLGFRIEAVILHDGVAGKVPEKVEGIAMIIYTPKNEKQLERFLGFLELESKLIETKGIFTGRFEK